MKLPLPPSQFKYRKLQHAACYNVRPLAHITLSYLSHMFSKQLCFYGHRIEIHLNEYSPDYTRPHLPHQAVPEPNLVFKNFSLSDLGDMFSIEPRCRFIVCLVTMSFGQRGDTVDPVTGNIHRSGHANVVMYDRKTGIGERWDPNGAHLGGAEYTRINESIARELKSHVTGFRNLRSIQEPPIVECPVGLQNLQSRESQTRGLDGYCMSWSILYVVFRALNPDLPGEFAIHAIRNYFKENELSLTEYIDSWNRFFVYIRTEAVKYKLGGKQISDQEACDYLAKLDDKDIRELLQKLADGQIPIPITTIETIDIPTRRVTEIRDHERHDYNPYMEHNREDDLKRPREVYELDEGIPRQPKRAREIEALEY